MIFTQKHGVLLLKRIFVLQCPRKAIINIYSIQTTRIPAKHARAAEIAVFWITSRQENVPQIFLLRVFPLGDFGKFHVVSLADRQDVLGVLPSDFQRWTTNYLKVFI